MREFLLTVRVGRASSVIACLSFGLGCGGSASSTPSTTASTQAAAHAELQPFDGEAFLVRYAHEHHALPTRPETSVGDLETRRRAARRAEDKRPLTRDLALVHFAQADEATDEAQARTEYEAAVREAKVALRGAQDPHLAELLGFVVLWSEFRLHAPTAGASAQSYVQTQTASSDTTRVAWMARGEIALSSSDWSTARDSFRYVMGDFSSPLYGYALARTAVAYEGEGRADEARDSLRFVVETGCSTNAAPENVMMAQRAWDELGRPTGATPPPNPAKPFCATTSSHEDALRR